MATAGSMPKPCAGSSLPTSRSRRCKLGELWAIPIMLRLALIENLRRVGGRVIAEKIDRRLAEHWADQLMDVVERDPKNVVLAVADMARSDPPMSSSFVAEFTRRLLGQSSALALPLTWVEHWLSGAGYTIEHLVQMEAQQQAADQVSIGNSIGSLRALSAIDWREFVESMSLVETTLREDPAGVYPGMDFATRDHYRHVVESVARRSNASESEVARAAVGLADAAQSARRSHARRACRVLSPGRWLATTRAGRRCAHRPRRMDAADLAEVATAFLPGQHRRADLAFCEAAAAGGQRRRLQGRKPVAARLPCASSRPASWQSRWSTGWRR